jgi:alpha-ribazole phosphatase
MDTLIDLLRHGEPVGGRMYRGSIDHPLSERGWAQMRAATAKPAPWQHIVSSPLARCSAFAEDLASRLGIGWEIDARLREVGFGSWEGQTGAELRAGDPDILKRFYHDPVGQRPAGAEPLDSFLHRVGQSLDTLQQQHAGRHLLVVCHAGVIRAAIAHVLDAPLAAMYRLDVANAALTRLKRTNERPLTVVFHNRTVD